MINKGIKNELIYINYLNKKQVKQLNPLMQELIHVLYDNIDENDIVYATKNKEKDKTDITIIIFRKHNKQHRKKSKPKSWRQKLIPFRTNFRIHPLFNNK